MTLRHPARPCTACPWVKGNTAAMIPGYDHDLAEGLAHTCPDHRGHGPDLGAPVFTCHESPIGKERACAGWLATNGAAHPRIRLAVITDDLDPAALAPRPDWPPLHATFHDVITNLRATRHDTDTP